MSSNLIDIDLQGYEPDEEPEEPKDAETELLKVRPIGRVATRWGSQRKAPHPPGPAGLDLPPTRVWIKRPPGPAGLDAPGHARRSSVPRARQVSSWLCLGARRLGLALR